MAITGVGGYGQQLGEFNPAVLLDGQIIGFGRDVTHANASPLIANVWTVTVDSAADDTEFLYSVSANQGDVDVSFTSGTSATTSTIATGLRAAHDAAPVARGAASAGGTTADVVLTAVWPGTDGEFNVTESDANLSVVETTAAQDPSSIDFAKLVIILADDASVVGQGLKSAALPAQANMTALSEAFDVTFVASSFYNITVTLDDGTVRNVQVAANTNDDTTAGDIRTALGTLLTSDPITVSGATNQWILTADDPGRAFSVSITGDHVQASSNRSTASTNINNILGGIAVRSDGRESSIVDDVDAVNPPRSPFQARVEGRFAIEEATLAVGGTVFVETAAGDDQGRLFGASSATRYAIDPDKISVVSRRETFAICRIHTSL